MDTDLILRNASVRSGLPYASLKKILDEVPEFLTPKADTLALIHRIKEKGHKLYILSNMHHDPMRHLLETYSFFDLFDGKVASCWVGLVKPDAAIYEHILKEFALNPAETVFIDDIKTNVDAAALQGIHPIHFKSAEDLEKSFRTWIVFNRFIQNIPESVEPAASMKLITGRKSGSSFILNMPPPSRPKE